MADLTPDGVALAIAPKVEGKVVLNDAVTFRGWLGEGAGDGAGEGEDAGDPFRIYTSPWCEEWFELTRGDVLHRVTGEQTTDGSSFIWVKAGSRITKCATGTALYFAKQDLDEGDDPTTRKWPRT